MTEAKVTFIYDCNNLIIQCKKEERMKDICQRYSTKLGINLNLLIFQYGGQQINTQLTFNEISPKENDIKIIVIKSEQDELICPKCGSNIIVNTEKIDEIVNSMNNIKETIIGIKVMIDNVIKTSMQNLMNIQLKNINLLLNNVNDDFNKISEKIKNLIKDNTFTNYQQNKNVIRGLIYINTTDINKDIVLFKTDAHNDIDVFINNQKINVINDKKKWKYKFSKEGNYILEIIFNNNITNMIGYFEESTNIISLDLSNFNASNVTNMSWMFNECHKLKEIKGIDKFNTNKVTDMNTMFQCCYELEHLDLFNFNTSNVTNMSCMFTNCYKLKEIKGIDKFNTNKVTDMKAMFQNCYELEHLDLFNFNTSNVTDMSYMFNECHKLKEIKGINKFNTNKVTDMKAMFGKCCELEHLDLFNFNTSNVTNMSCMFNECHKLKEIKGIDKFNTNKVTDMSGMFQCCYELEHLDLFNFNTSNVTNMSYMFNKCYKLKEIKGIDKFNTNKVTDMNTMFQACYELEHLDLSNFNTSNVTNMSRMFFNCNKLKYLNLLNFSINCDTKNMFKNINKKNCQFKTNNNDLLNIYNSS